MARNARPTAAKREREKTLNERRQQKAARRQDVKQRKATETPRPDGVDPFGRHANASAQFRRIKHSRQQIGHFIDQ